MKNSKNLSEGPIKSTLFSLTIPLFIGMIAIMFFQIADTYYLGQLGADELSAMGYIFPIFFAFESIMFGIGGGVTALVSFAYGKKDFEQVRKLTTHSILLGMVIIAVLSSFGLFSINLVFSSLGASGHVLELIAQYMSIYYLTVFLLALPIISNSANRAVGDTKSPAIIMSTSAIINIILDPILIFGLGPIPALGMRGAAIATSLAWVISATASFYIIKRLNMLEFSIPSKAQLFSSWSQILFIGIPACMSNLVMPLTVATITFFVSAYGHEAVGGFGVATRVESLAIIGIISISGAVSPFVGQNFGAKNFERINSGMSLALKSASAWGLLVSVIIMLFAPQVAYLFSSDENVVKSAVLYFTIVPFCYWAWGISALTYSFLYSIKKPIWAGALIILRLLVFMIFFSYIGSILFGLAGLFAGMALAEVLSACVSYMFYSKALLEIKKSVA